ncbi:MAG: hypothetical protein LBC43_04315 [Bifidobacteriaceae bacterium]|nr:hypothetical protein [Bifidobacteriaceae bacterium]
MKSDSEEVYDELLQYLKRELEGVKPGNNLDSRQKVYNFLTRIDHPVKLRKLFENIYVHPDSAGPGLNSEHLHWILVTAAEGINPGVYIRFYYTPLQAGLEKLFDFVFGFEQEIETLNIYPPENTKFMNKFSVIRATKIDSEWGVTGNDWVDQEKVFEDIPQLLHYLFLHEFREFYYANKSARSNKGITAWRPNPQSPIRATLNDWAIVQSDDDLDYIRGNIHQFFAKFDKTSEYLLYGYAKNDPRHNPETGAFKDGHRIVTSAIVSIDGNDYYTDSSEIYTLDPAQMDPDYQTWMIANQVKKISWREMIEQWKKWGGPLLHLCEVCGKEETLTPEEAYNQNWNYPPKCGSFRVVSPRTCANCSIKNTLWWDLTFSENLVSSVEELNERHRATLWRIQREPLSIMPDGLTKADILRYLVSGKLKSKKVGAQQKKKKVSHDL